MGGLATALRNDMGVSSLGDAYALYAEFFKVFAIWSNQLDSARSRVDACKKTDAFRRALASCQQDPRTDGADLLNWLSRPSQHVMRQPLVLGNLLDFTPPQHPSRAALEEAMEKIKAVVSAVDAKKRDYEQRTRLVELHTSVRGLEEVEELVQPHRQLLREGELAELRRGASLKEGGGGQLGQSNSREELGAAMESGGGGGGGGGGLLRCFGTEDGPSHRYGLLCNDSFWYCEMLRGNTYNLIHVFHLRKPSDGGILAPTGAGKTTSRKRASVFAPSPKKDVGASEDSADEANTKNYAVVEAAEGDSFWLKDSQLSVQLKPASSSQDDSHEWLATLLQVSGSKMVYVSPFSAC